MATMREIGSSPLSALPFLPIPATSGLTLPSDCCTLPSSRNSTHPIIRRTDMYPYAGPEVILTCDPSPLSPCLRLIPLVLPLSLAYMRRVPPAPHIARRDPRHAPRSRHSRFTQAQRARTSILAHPVSVGSAFSFSSL